jgi:hypothetical protein
MITSQNFPLLMAAFLVVAMALAQCSGGSDKDLEDCSRRGKPQHHRGGGEWSCLTESGASYSIAR